MGRIDVIGPFVKMHLIARMGGTTVAFAVALSFAPVSTHAVCAQPAQQTAPAKTPPAVGTIKSISGNVIVLATQAGTDLTVQLGPDTKFLRVPPESRDLKEATPIGLTDLQAGDRILARGKPGDEASTFLASTIISMKKADIEQKKARDQEEWQRHGIGGLVKEVDATNGTVTIGTVSAAGPKDVAINISKSTVLRRYAAGSVKFDDAKISTFAEIHAGDQLRARGSRSVDGNGFTAEEVVTGSFQNVSGTISAVDAGAGTLTVADLLSNKSVTLNVKPDTQLRKLPAPMAQAIAARLKGAANGAATPPGAAGGGAPPQGGSNAVANGAGPAQQSNRGPGGPGGAGNGAGARGDLQQMLMRLPASTLNDFQKGDAVLIVAATSPNDKTFSAITIVGGVEPILQASPQGQASSILSPWSLSGGGADAGTP